MNPVPPLKLAPPEFRPGDPITAGDPCALVIPITVQRDLIFDLDVSVELLPAAGGEPIYARHLRQDGVDVSWLPAGEFRVRWHTGALALPPGDYLARCTGWAGGLGDPKPVDHIVVPFQVVGEAGSGSIQGGWDLESGPSGPSLENMSWRKGHEDWFFRHFDHAARTIISYMLGDSPLLKGRVLDVGCGDGITDLSVALRCEPELLIGIDPFKGFERLPGILAENHLPLSELPDNLRFEPADANEIPYPDDSFDVVLSWGSLEHIAGGYDQALKEIKRVLRDGGLFFAHPGLYYSNFGHHIGEFTQEPFVHLTRSPEEIKDIIFNTEPQYMDRSGEFSPPEDYWRWYNELNPMTVATFEQELKDLGFEFYRVALRTEDRIEYHHPALQNYGMQDLATVELYLSAWNRK